MANLLPPRFLKGGHSLALQAAKHSTVDGKREERVVNQGNGKGEHSPVFLINIYQGGTECLWVGQL